MPSETKENSQPFPWEASGETVVLETPEQATVEFRIAPFGARIAAAMYDYLILTVVQLVLLAGLAFAGDSLSGIQQEYLMTGMTVLAFLLPLAYFILFEALDDGRTIGKRRLKLRTVREDGRGVTLGASVIRNLARLVDNIPLFWLLPMLDKRRRRIGDWLGGTLVLSTAAVDAQEYVFDPSRPATATDRRDFHIGADVAAKLFLDDLNLLEHLFARLPQVPTRQREKLVNEVAEKYIDRLGAEDLREQVRQDPKRFLFELYLLLRERHERDAV
ncbi:MAG: RDD family protein [Planctomycetota bacterium]|jgi:uncharacterized RDD family membrane protein YckC